ncbi:S8 family serine peptidase [Hyphomicrobium sp. CS1GBMeth3]|uniref:S8 family serine peptidase n=1 Tax=Hyphomicrobium sp. CS1GBMeth3 TaxID=1892845 RepID=UPI0009FABEDC|nr:S8 family serine peptidase [Hyphomicrobium sp. CS1GBMeth3]
MKTDTLERSPICWSAPGWGRAGLVAVLSLSSSAMLQLDRARAGEVLASAAPGKGWVAEVEFAAEPGSESDPWRARTFAHGFSDSPRPNLPVETVPVRWLDGFQKQASHLGVVGGGFGAKQTEDADYTFGLSRLVKSVAVRTFGVVPTPDHGHGAHVVSSLPAPEKKAPSNAYSIFAGMPGNGGDFGSVILGVERAKASPASLEPCPSDICFGRELVAWSKALRSCTQDVRIGIIDTSFDISHPAFKKLKAIRKEFLDDVYPSDEDWHGTAILSLLAGDPDSGTPGLVPDATFLLATAFRSDAAGNASTDTGKLLEALDWLDKLDVDIVNMSFAGPRDPAVAKAIERMSLKGVVFVAAAGNMGPAAGASYPAAYPHVIAVTAVNRDGESYRNANRGAYVDIAAPGVDVLTALPGAKQGFQTGTSFAAPFVTAILATRISSGIIEGTEQHLLDQLPVRDLGISGRDPVYGVGLVLAPKQCPSNMVAKATVSKSASKSRAKKLANANATSRPARN